MKDLKRLSIYLLINVIVSAATTLLVLLIWSRNQTPITLEPPATSTPIVLDQPQTTQNIEEGNSTAPAGDDVSGQLEITSIVGAGDYETEHVKIKHVGEKEILLAGWALEDEDGNTYSFPALTMYPDAAVSVYTKVGTDRVMELFWGLLAPAWSSGETVLLLDPAGNIQATYTIP
jgi:hypothetical protein